MGVGVGLYMYDVVVKKFTFAISSPDEFLFWISCTRVGTTTKRNWWSLSLCKIWTELVE